MKFCKINMFAKNSNLNVMYLTWTYLANMCQKIMLLFLNYLGFSAAMSAPIRSLWLIFIVCKETLLE